MRFPGRLSCALALGAVGVTVLASCGGNGSTTSASEGTTEQSASGATKPLPPNAPMTKVLATRFPKPKPQPGSPPGAKKAIQAGRKACKGKTPLQVREEFIGEAKASELMNPGQEKMIGHIEQYEKQSSHSPDFVAGQLAAGVYEATLPEDLRIAGYQGCVYELARQLEKELSRG